VVRRAASASHLYLSVPWNGERTYVIRVRPGEPFAGLPAQGIRSDADLSRLPVVRVIEEAGSAPADDGSVYAFTRVDVQRNVYRIPLP
jgi:hypothetical protein